MAKSNDSGDKFLKLILVAAVIIIGGYVILGNDKQPTQNYPTQASIGGGGGGQQQIIVAPQQPAASSNTYHSGTLTLRPRDGVGNAGVSSTMLFLSKTQALDTNGNPMFNANGNLNPGAIYSEEKTRYSIMKKMQTYGAAHSTPDSLSYFGSEAQNAVASGAWAQTISANVGDYILAYTYIASGNTFSAPAASTNISTAKLIKLSGWNDPNQNWDAQFWNGGTPDWSLYSYPALYFVNDAGVVADNYTVGDSGTIASRRTWKFYFNATGSGEDSTTSDVGLFLIAPKNFTSKLSDITLSPRSTFGQGSIKITSLDTTYQDDRGSVAQAASLLTGRVPSFNDQLYYITSIPIDWITRRTSSDRNQVEGTMIADTYGASVNTTLYAVANVHAKGTSNGAFILPDNFDLKFSSGSTSGYNVTAS